MCLSVNTVFLPSQIVPGNLPGGTVSIESASRAGFFFRHRNGFLELDHKDGTDDLFDQVRHFHFGGCPCFHVFSYVTEISVRLTCRCLVELCFGYTSILS